MKQSLLRQHCLQVLLVHECFQTFEHLKRVQKYLFRVAQCLLCVQSPAAALLTLDLASKLDSLPLKKRLSTLGCTILTAIIAFAKVSPRPSEISISL